MNSEWKNLRLGSFCDVIAGGTPPRSNSAYYGGSIPWVKISDMLQGEITETDEKITEEALANCNTKLLPAGTILLSIFATIGRSAVLRVPATTNQAIVGIIPRMDDVDKLYFRHFLDSASVSLASKGRGVAQNNINSSILRDLEIPIPHKNDKPDLDEQKRIAAILDKADAIRRKLQQSLRLSDDFLRSVFLDMFGSDKSPKCERVPLGPFLEFMTSGGRGWSQYYAPSGARFIRSLDVQMNEIGEKDVAYVAAPNNAEAKRTRVQENDVLLTITGSLIGRVARIPKEHAGAYISQHVAILRLGKGLDPEYLARFLSMDEGQRLVQKSQYGQTKPGLNFDQIRRFTVPLPSATLQKRFVDLANRVTASSMKSRAFMSDSETLFSSLQQRAFRGEL